MRSTFVWGCDFELEIRWPDGTVESYPAKDIGNNRFVTVTYGPGVSVN